MSPGAVEAKGIDREARPSPYTHAQMEAMALELAISHSPDRMAAAAGRKSAAQWLAEATSSASGAPMEALFKAYDHLSRRLAHQEYNRVGDVHSMDLAVQVPDVAAAAEQKTHGFRRDQTPPSPRLLTTPRARVEASERSVHLMLQCLPDAHLELPRTDPRITAQRIALHKVWAALYVTHQEISNPLQKREACALIQQALDRIFDELDHVTLPDVRGISQAIDTALARGEKTRSLEARFKRSLQAYKAKLRRIDAKLNVFYSVLEQLVQEQCGLKTTRLAGKYIFDAERLIVMEVSRDMYATVTYVHEEKTPEVKPALPAEEDKGAGAAADEAKPEEEKSLRYYKIIQIAEPIQRYLTEKQKREFIRIRGVSNLQRPDDDLPDDHWFVWVCHHHPFLARQLQRLIPPEATIEHPHRGNWTSLEGTIPSTLRCLPILSNSQRDWFFMMEVKKTSAGTYQVVYEDTAEGRKPSIHMSSVHHRFSLPPPIDLTDPHMERERVRIAILNVHQFLEYSLTEFIRNHFDIYFTGLRSEALAAQAERNPTLLRKLTQAGLKIIEAPGTDGRPKKVLIFISTEGHQGLSTEGTIKQLDTHTRSYLARFIYQLKYGLEEEVAGNKDEATALQLPIPANALLTQTIFDQVRDLRDNNTRYFQELTRAYHSMAEAYPGLHLFTTQTAVNVGRMLDISRRVNRPEDDDYYLKRISYLLRKGKLTDNVREMLEAIYTQLLKIRDSVTDKHGDKHLLRAAYYAAFQRIMETGVTLCKSGVNRTTLAHIKAIGGVVDYGMRKRFVDFGQDDMEPEDEERDMREREQLARIEHAISLYGAHAAGTNAFTTGYRSEDALPTENLKAVREYRLKPHIVLKQALFYEFWFLLVLHIIVATLDLTRSSLGVFFFGVGTATLFILGTLFYYFYNKYRYGSGLKMKALFRDLLLMPIVTTCLVAAAAEWAPQFLTFTLLVLIAISYLGFAGYIVYKYHRYRSDRIDDTAIRMSRKRRALADEQAAIFCVKKYHYQFLSKKQKEILQLVAVGLVFGFITVSTFFSPFAVPITFTTLIIGLGLQQSSYHTWLKHVGTAIAVVSAIIFMPAVL
ncbi:MAG TPA: hypothetical protein VJB02_05130, partial [Coxiellaceae bacterium]|nr:hypothetical protein [Coxiellaceae bacterium]